MSVKLETNICHKHGTPKFRRPNGKWACNPCWSKTIMSSRKRNPVTARNQFLRSHYGITQSDYLLILESQGGRCAICRTDSPETKWHKTFSVDHCHATGKVRGLLCQKCNMAIGYLKDSPEAADSAAAYLRKHGR